jgi:uncharacterized protein
VAWSIALIPVVAQQTLGVDLPLEAFLIAATLFGLLLPTLVITWLVDGTAGIEALRKSSTKVRSSVG